MWRVCGVEEATGGSRGARAGESERGTDGRRGGRGGGARHAAINGPSRTPPLFRYLSLSPARARSRLCLCSRSASHGVERLRRDRGGHDAEGEQRPAAGARVGAHRRVGGAEAARVSAAGRGSGGSGGGGGRRARRRGLQHCRCDPREAAGGPPGGLAELEHNVVKPEARKRARKRRRRAEVRWSGTGAVCVQCGERDSASQQENARARWMRPLARPLARAHRTHRPASRCTGARRPTQAWSARLSAPTARCAASAPCSSRKPE